MEVSKCKQTHEFGFEDYYDKVIIMVNNTPL